MSDCVCQSNPLSKGIGSRKAKEGQFCQQVLRQLKPFLVSIFVEYASKTVLATSELFDIKMPRVSWGTTHVHGHRGICRRATMHAGWPHRLFSGVLVPAGPRTPPAPRDRLVWR